MLHCCATMLTMTGMKLNSESFRARAKIMKALANEVRLMIVDELSRGERCMCELQPLFKMNKSTLSRHITELKNAGIVSERREGVRTYLDLATPCILNIFDCAMRVIKADLSRKSRILKGN